MPKFAAFLLISAFMLKNPDPGSKKSFPFQISSRDRGGTERFLEDLSLDIPRDIDLCYAVHSGEVPIWTGLPQGSHVGYSWVRADSKITPKWTYAVNPEYFWKKAENSRKSIKVVLGHVIITRAHRFETKNPKVAKYEFS